jgi:hypothetical protein
MKHEHAWTLPAAAACAALLSLALFAPPAASAQTRGSQEHAPPPPPVRDDNIPRPPSIRERQFIMEAMEREARKGAPPSKSEELRMTEIAEDYRDLQQVNNKMMASAMRAAEPDYKMVAGSLADIRRRAERLRENLALPQSGDKDEKKSEPKPFEDAAGMKAALLALDRSIMSFVGSPLFKNTDVLDAEAAARAARDLKEVIELSRQMNKDAERLSKAAGKR